MNDRLKLEAFYLLMNMAPVFNFESLQKLLACIKAPEKLWQLKESDISGLDIQKKDIDKLFEKLEFHTLHKLADVINSTDAHIVLCEDSNYPVRLKKAKYPPLMLFYKGDIDIINEAKITVIVGTRNASGYGRSLAKRYASGALDQNAILLTGTAKGIDTEILDICIKRKKKALSVLASGIDKISPKQSEDLLNECVSLGGCYFTEFPPGVGSFKSNYPIRSKLMALLADEVIIVEAPKKSGALLVAEEAANLGKKVYTPPSYIDDENFWGNHNLIRSGKARLIVEYADVKS